jgi:hypothetical protein
MPGRRVRIVGSALALIAIAGTAWADEGAQLPLIVYGSGDPVPHRDLSAFQDQSMVSPPSEPEENTRDFQPET